MTFLPPPIPNSPPPAASTAVRGDPLREAAVQLEGAFLAEMLKSAGLGSVPKGFGGGSGEDQFQSLLVREQARLMAESGGIGLAESLYNALKERRDD